MLGLHKGKIDSGGRVYLNVISMSVSLYVLNNFILNYSGSWTFKAERARTVYAMSLR